MHSPSITSYVVTKALNLYAPGIILPWWLQAVKQTIDSKLYKYLSISIEQLILMYHLPTVSAIGL